MNYSPRLCSLGILVTALSGCGGALYQKDDHAVQRNDVQGPFTSETIDDVLTYAVKVEVLVTMKPTNPDLLSQLEGKRSIGSGTALSGNYVLTATHVLPEFMQVIDHDEQIITTYEVLVQGQKADVIKKDQEKDLALLKLEHCSKKEGCLKPYTGTVANQINVGDAVVGAGYPTGEFTLFSGFVSGRTVYENKELALIDANISGGNSGSPVFVFQKGKPLLAGIVLGSRLEKGPSGQFMKTGTAAMTPLPHLREFLKEVSELERYITP